MDLKVQTDYALRTLLYLAHKAQVHNEPQASVDEISTAYAISKDHLFKVVQHLVRLGYIASKPGRAGGVRLRKPADQITIDRVVADFEGRNGVLACVAEPTVCVLEPGCVLRHALIDAENAFYDSLAKMTVADCVRASGEEAGVPRGGIYNLTIRRSSLASTSATASVVRAAAAAGGVAAGAASETNAE
jgi:Rrf2 family nitric oxide-sensitive transcriptional repressor